MSHRLSDEMVDARWTTYLDGRAEDGAARARTPEQVAAEIGRHVGSSSGISRGAPRALRLAWLVVVTAVVLALLVWLAAGGRLPSVVPVRVVRIAIDLPLGGSDKGAAPIANGIMLAVDDANGRTGRFQIEIPGTSILSDVVDGVPDASQGAANMRQIVADPNVVAVIGPYGSFIALEQIPISNAAGLLQCSPGNTDPELTQRAGSGNQAASSPGASRVSYIRTVTRDDVAAAAAARYVYERLGKTSVFVIDDHQGIGPAMADWFAAEFGRLGGRIVARASLPTSAAEIATMLTAVRAKQPQAIYFGGNGDRGATLLRAAAQAGLGEIPFVGTDALLDGGVGTPGSFLSLAGQGASRAISIFPGLPNGPQNAAFEARYRARYGADPTAFAAAGYACAQVVIAALKQIDAGQTANMASLRDAVRVAGANPETTFETILGPIAFDANGDVTPRRVTIYAYDSTTRDWATADQIDAVAALDR